LEKELKDRHEAEIAAFRSNGESSSIENLVDQVPKNQDEPNLAAEMEKVEIAPV
jgi:hypothetical protein